MPKSIDKYDHERNELLQKLLNILEIKPENNKFSLKELDGNIEKQNAIIELESDVKKYFLCSRWSYFSNKNRNFKRNYLSLIKTLCKQMNVKLITSTMTKKYDNNTTESETYYYINLSSNN
jgi:hypothetical protein